MAEEYMSFKPSDAIHGGGMVPEGRYKITDAKCAMWDYNGNIPSAVPALAVEYKNADEQTSIQYYSAGDPRNWEPTPDGKRFKKVGTGGALNDQTNCFAFWRAAIAAGLSEDKVGTDCTILIGMDVDIVHEASPGRDIKGQKKKASAIPVISKIWAMPGEKPKTTTAKSGKTAPSNGAETNAALAPKTTAVLIEALKGADGKTLEKKALTTAMFKKIPASDADRANILNLAIQDSFLSSLTDSGVLFDTDKGQVMYVGE